VCSRPLAAERQPHHQHRTQHLQSQDVHNIHAPTASCTSPWPLLRFRQSRLCRVQLASPLPTERVPSAFGWIPVGLARRRTDRYCHPGHACRPCDQSFPGTHPPPSCKGQYAIQHSRVTPTRPGRAYPRTGADLIWPSNRRQRGLQRPGSRGALVPLDAVGWHTTWSDPVSTCCASSAKGPGRRRWTRIERPGGDRGSQRRRNPVEEGGEATIRTHTGKHAQLDGAHLKANGEQSESRKQHGRSNRSEQDHAEL
jgi:hypothetical protein